MIRALTTIRSGSGALADEGPSRGPPWADRVRTLLAGLGRLGLDAIYPPHCMACRASITGPRGLCPSCWSAVRFITRPYCDRLGTPFEVDLGAGLVSPEALAAPPAYARARAVACFDDGPVRALIHQFKYADRPDYAKTLGAWMERAGRDLVPDADVIVPVPLHPRRLWERRYNQAALLALAIGRLTGKPVDLTSLRRVKATQSQVGMTRSQRADNIQGAFRLDPGGRGVRAARVLLVDDVLTTGATVNAAANVLLRSGAAAVDVLVFARVVTTA